MEEEIKTCLDILLSGGIILYPTDTVWGIGCDASNADAVQKIYALKKRDDTKSMLCLVSDERMLEAHVNKVPYIGMDIIAYATRPTTLILDNPKGVAKNLIAADNSLGIRVVDDEFCRKLIRRLGKPLVSTSANISGTATPKGFHDIQQEIKNGVDYVVGMYHDKVCDKPSAIIKLKEDGEVEVIRS